MAYTKIVPIKTGTHLEQAIHYILNPDKTEEMLYVSTYMCDKDTAAEDFKTIYDKAIHKGNNVAHQITLSFSPEDKITPEQALDMGRELMEKIYPDNQYVLAIHNDREHLHAHIIVNAVDYVNYKKIHSNKQSLREMRDICDKMCKERGLSVIEKETKAHRKRLIASIDEAIEKSSGFDDFIENMQLAGYEVKIDKYLYFRGENEENFRRSDTMGDAYSVIGIKQRLQGIDVPRGKRRIYADKTIRISLHRRLQFAIDDMLKAANSYDELLGLLSNEGIEIKQGAHLAMKLPIAKRYIRTESIGEEYSEKMLRFYFDNKAGYNALKTEINSVKQEHLQKKRTYTDRYTSIRNIDVEIRMLNMLSEYNIKSIDDLQAKIDSLSKKIEVCDSNISLANEEIKSRQTVVNAMREYWRLKPIIAKYKAISDSKTKELFYVENMADIEQYNKVTEILNANKLPDGTLPKADQLRAEIAEYKQSKGLNYDNKEDLKTELQKYEILMSNIKTIIKDEPQKAEDVER
ncbi:MAG: relaxase/mobilization nuclease domain-containing protein [Firmicutes bacterium]|nr:relaxase/mobilization nuclease domain-containing protein [Bacillota bacterium]